MSDGARQKIDKAGEFLVDGFQLFALFVLGGTIVWAAAYEYLRMIEAGRAKLDDILLLFIYVELGAMVGMYFKTNRLPVLFLLYIAITAITRFLVADIHLLTPVNVLIFTGALLMLAVAVLVLQVVIAKFSASEEPKITEH
jgi:protein PsiE